MQGEENRVKGERRAARLEALHEEMGPCPVCKQREWMYLVCAHVRPAGGPRTGFCMTERDQPLFVIASPTLKIFREGLEAAKQITLIAGSPSTLSSGMVRTPCSISLLSCITCLAADT